MFIKILGVEQHLEMRLFEVKLNSAGKKKRDWEKER